MEQFICLKGDYLNSRRFCACEHIFNVKSIVSIERTGENCCLLRVNVLKNGKKETVTFYAVEDYKRVKAERDIHSNFINIKEQVLVDLKNRPCIFLINKSRIIEIYQVDEKGCTVRVKEERNGEPHEVIYFADGDIGELKKVLCKSHPYDEQKEKITKEIKNL